MNPKPAFIAWACFILLGCSPNYHQFAANYHFAEPAGEPDYSSLTNWAAHPYKRDPSDSVPRPLRAGYRPDSATDVFFIHPTTYTEAARPFGWNAPVANADLDAKTDYSTILNQASIFNEAGRVFAPRYRQAHLSAYYPLDHDDTVHAAAAFETAYQDVRAAFTYYLKHFNSGRPVIIAAHSQGATHGKRLLKEFFDGTGMQGSLVVAYLVGMPLEPGLFSSIKGCSTPSETGCVCAWRTFQEGYTPAYIEKEKAVSIVTNPLTWNADEPVAGREKNSGAILLNFNKLPKKVVGAAVHGGVLWTEKPHFVGNIFLTSKNYHIADMNFFWLSIRQNVRERSTAYHKKQIRTVL